VVNASVENGDGDDGRGNRPRPFLQSFDGQ
jgi:hypothetical protein